MFSPLKQLLLTITSFYLHHFLATSQPYFVIGIAIDCGSTKDGIVSGRTWNADVNSKLSRLEQQNESWSFTALESLSTVNDVPYRTARLSRSQFNYTFPVTSGQKFVRLHFFPATYKNFSSSTALFSVKAGVFTLVSNFSALLHAQSQGSEVLVKEFILNVAEDQLLNVSFTPSPDVADAYAFINGIEIVSMPENLYYTASGDQGVLFVSQNKRMQIDNSSTALELMYRVNMAQSSISPEQDTGMYRSWSTDNAYLTDSGDSVLLSSDSVQLVYKDDLNRYAAPAQVYKSGRSMGPSNYSLTWEFSVDSVFTYLVRLHFCQFVSLFTEKRGRVFQIIIANRTADHHADIIRWSGGNGIPVYRDFAVLIGAKGSAKVQNLSVALQTIPDFLTSDVILNGLELFKLSNSYNLSSPNPDPITTSQQSSKSKTNGKGRKVVFAIVGVPVLGILVLLIVVSLLLRKRIRAKEPGARPGDLWLDECSSSTKSAKQNRLTLPTDLCRRFSLAEIKTATKNFDAACIVGVGGFGNVYKGFIDEGTGAVAIKRLNPGSEQGVNEFKTEIEMLSQLRHIHLVSLIGYCSEGGEMVLVYDYMCQGTIRDHLYNTNKPPLPWHQRLEICIGAARGLQYLHSGVKHRIIHRDVKTTNILLDGNWVAKISDFGLSKIGANTLSKTHVSTVVKGSFGYLDPEYFQRQQLTEKSDVYSFGVVLFEVLCARPALDRTVEDDEQVSLALWARECCRGGTVDQIIDPYIKGEIKPDCLEKFIEVAVSCLLENGAKRPSMGDVVWGLEFALKLQEGPGEDIKVDGAAEPCEMQVDNELSLSSFSDGDLIYSLTSYS